MNEPGQSALLPYQMRDRLREGRALLGAASSQITLLTRDKSRGRRLEIIGMAAKKLAKLAAELAQFAEENK